MVTLRRVRELHPVSRHVFPFRSESGSVLRFACRLSSRKIIVREYPVTLRSFRVEASRVGKPAQTPNTSLLLLLRLLLLFCVSICLPVRLLRCLCASQPANCGRAADSVRYHLPSSFPLNGPCVTLAGARRHSSPSICGREKK